MNSIASIVKPMFVDLVKPLGFVDRNVMSGVGFYRLMDGFVQSFKIYAMYSHASIRFFMSPLCAGVDLTHEGDDISNFWCNSSAFIYVKSLQGGIEMPKCYIEENPEGGEPCIVNLNILEVDTPDECAQMLLSLFKEHLLPWFEKYTTLEKACQAGIDLHYVRRLNELGGDTAENKALALSEVRKNLARTKFLWMMQMGLYEQAVQSLDIQLEDETERLREENIPYNIPEVVRQSIKENYRTALSNIQELRTRIVLRDMNFINRYVAENTEKTLSNLRLKRAKMWYGK